MYYVIGIQEHSAGARKQHISAVFEVRGVVGYAD